MKKLQLWLYGGLTVSFSSALSVVACGYENYLVARGSNSTSPINSLISHHTAFDVIYNPDGSTYGARAMAQANIHLDYAMVSSRKAPGELGGVEGIDYSDDKKGKAQEIINWNNNKVRTLTFAIDGIGIGLNLPSQVKTILGDQQPIINFDTLAMIYSIPRTNSQFPAWKQLLVNEGMDRLPDNLKPFPLAVEGGISTSGKAETFISKIMTSTWFKAHQKTLPVEKIKHHDTSIIPLEYQVSDREQEMYSKNNNVVGSVMYYALGYIIRNDQSDHVTLSAIKNGNETWIPTIKNAQDHLYPWLRPFNIIYQVENYDLAVEKNSLVSTILSEEFQNLIALKGFVRLSQDLIKLQSVEYKITDPDKKVNQDKRFNYGLIL